MRVLLACDIATGGGDNPYTLQLLHALEMHPAVEAVQHGTSWMHVPDVSFDVVHVQWPEALVGWEEPSEAQLRRIREALKRWADEAVVVAAVHNKYPHDHKDSTAYQALYRLVYAAANGIVHLGETSKEVIRRRYESEASVAWETVIPHGDYSWFPNNSSRSESRNKLGLSERDRVVLHIGYTRNTKELDLLKRGILRRYGTNRKAPR